MPNRKYKQDPWWVKIAIAFYSGLYEIKMQCKNMAGRRYVFMDKPDAVKMPYGENNIYGNKYLLRWEVVLCEDDIERLHRNSRITYQIEVPVYVHKKLIRKAMKKTK